jgi:hypothetical protein
MWPSHGRPKTCIIHRIPNCKRPQENSCPRPGLCRTQESHAEKHEDRRSLPKHLESEKTLREFVYGLRLAIELSGQSDDIRQRPVITRQQSRGCSKIDHHCSFKESERGCEHTTDCQLPGREKNTGTPPRKVSKQRNKKYRVHPPRLRDESRHVQLTLRVTAMVARPRTCSTCVSWRREASYSNDSWFFASSTRKRRSP